MCSLNGFPPLPPEGEISLCEVHGHVHSMPSETADVHLITHAVSSHPQVSVTREMLHSTTYADNRKVLIPVSEPLLKILVSIWWEEGLAEALEFVTQIDESLVPRPLSIVASCALKAVNSLGRIRALVQPYPKVSRKNITGVVSATRDWEHSPVRCLAWHPHVTKLAVATLDDIIRVYSSDQVSSQTPCIVLKGKTQHNISCMAWRPISLSELAIGCDCGTLVWSLDPNSAATRPTMSCTTFLKQSNHLPVTSISWSPQGDLLLTTSATDANIYVWDVEKEQAERICRIGGGGVSFSTWSPDGSKVFTATMGTINRIWQTTNWMCERWTTFGRVQTACWSPCGSILLFCTLQESVVYSLKFSQSLREHIKVDSAEMTDVAIPAIDLTLIETDEGLRVGGAAMSMTWDKKGHHLAIIFRDSPVVAVFRTRILSTLLITPCCFINGVSGEVPNVICFQQNFEDGAMLSVAWSSGRVQHFPFIYSDLPEDRSFSSPS